MSSSLSFRVCGLHDFGSVSATSLFCGLDCWVMLVGFSGSREADPSNGTCGENITKYSYMPNINCRMFRLHQLHTNKAYRSNRPAARCE